MTSEADYEALQVSFGEHLEAYSGLAAKLERMEGELAQSIAEHALTLKHLARIEGERDAALGELAMKAAAERITNRDEGQPIITHPRAGNWAGHTTEGAPKCECDSAKQHRMGYCGTTEGAEPAELERSQEQYRLLLEAYSSEAAKLERIEGERARDRAEDYPAQISDLLDMLKEAEGERDRAIALLEEWQPKVVRTGGPQTLPGRTAAFLSSTAALGHTTEGGDVSE